MLVVLAIALGFAAVTPTTEAAFPGRNGVIAYIAPSSDIDGGPDEVWTVDLSSGATTQLTDLYAIYGPAWSDDGRTLALSLYVGREGFVIATVPWPRPVAAPWTYGDAEWMTFPVPAPPGNESVAWDFDPSWAPGGRQIVYWAAGSLIVLDADGTKHVIATGANTDGPAWSPDGQLIAFSRCTSEASGCSLWVVQPDGTRLRRLTDSRLNATAPNWSPDGRRLVFEANGGVWTIRRYEPRLRSRPQRLVESGAGPSWSPDGTQIAFARGDGVYVVDRDGRHPTRLVAMPPWAGLGRLQTDWQPEV